MTRAQRLKYCRICTNRKLDLKKGLLCGLTDELADFENTCSDFDEDVAEKKKLLKSDLRAAGEQGVGDSIDWAKNKSNGGIILFIGVMAAIALHVMGVQSLRFGMWLIIAAYSSIAYGANQIRKGIEQEKILAKHHKLERERKRKKKA